MTSNPLTAKEIWEQISKGQTVKIPNDPALAVQLYKHLNVIKSRTKKLFKSLGLDFAASIVSVEPERAFGIPTETIVGFQIKLIAPKEYKKYAAYVVPEKSLEQRNK